MAMIPIGRYKFFDTINLQILTLSDGRIFGATSDDTAKNKLFTDSIPMNILYNFKTYNDDFNEHINDSMFRKVASEFTNPSFISLDQDATEFFASINNEIHMYHTWVLGIHYYMFRYNDMATGIYQRIYSEFDNPIETMEKLSEVYKIVYDKDLVIDDKVSDIYMKSKDFSVVLRHIENIYIMRP